MTEKLRILILEDSAADAELLERQLKKAGILCSSQRVETRSEYLKALKVFKPDLILADYTLPKFNAMQALELARKKLPYTPFIVITGTIGEEKAVSCLRAGADDYLLKDRLARLGEAVLQALDKRRLHEEKARMEAMLQANELLYHTFIDSSNDMAFLKDDHFRHLLANQALCSFFGKPENEIIGKTDFKLMDKSVAAKCQKTDKQALAENRIHVSEETVGDLTFETSKFPVKLTNGRIGIGGYIRDISERKRTQDQIEHAKRKWTITFDAIKDGIALLAVDQTVRQVNRAFANLVKKPFPEIIGKKCYELMHSDRQPDPHCPFAKMLKSKKRESIELAVADRVFEMLVDPITNDAGNISGAAHIMSDITERKRAEGALRESEEQYRDLIEKGNIAIVIDDIDGNLIYFNNQFLNLFGYSAGEIEGKTHKDFLHPDSLKIVSNYHQKRVHNEKAPSRYEFKGIRKDGSTINVEIDVCEIIKKEGKASGTRSYMWDITERKKTEEALIDSENRYRNHFENSSEFNFTLDLKGNFIDVNQAAVALTGYAKSELLKMNFKDYTPKSDHRKLFRNLFNVYKTGKPLQNFLVEAVIKDKSKKYFETSISLMKEGERIIGYQGSSKDITERKHAEEQIRASLLEKEVLLKEIHHRVKNNLQVISGLLTLQAAQVNDERLQRMIKESQGRIWTMALIHQTLYQSGNLADIDMADYIRALSGNLLSSHAQVAMPPTVNFDLMPLRLVVDKAIPLALIINELVTNAMKHAFPDGQPGEIRISLQECRDKSRLVPTDDMGTARLAPERGRAPTYELTVADNGAGLPAGFDLKNQKSLGMQLVAMLAKQLGGSLAVESSSGTSIRIQFSYNEKSEKQP